MQKHKMICIMLFQVENTGHGYVVSVYDPADLGGWRPLRNFGDRQGDARDFTLYDCPHLDGSSLRLLMKSYDPSVKHIRISGKRFVRQMEP